MFKFSYERRKDGTLEKSTGSSICPFAFVGQIILRGVPFPSTFFRAIDELERSSRRTTSHIKLEASSGAVLQLE